MKPPFGYYGGKVGLAAAIVRLMPEHDAYIEPFFGSGAVFFAKPRVRHEIVNDIEGNLVHFFRVLRQDPEVLERACRLSPHAREEFETCSDLDVGDDIERARRFFVRINQSFNSGAGATAGWRSTTARTQSFPDTLRTRLGRFADVAERLTDVSIECCDAVDLIQRLASSSTCLYVDPPYLASTRRGGRGIRHSDYRVEMADDESHRRLAAALNSTAAAVILSGYPSPLYEELYAGWWHVDIEVATRTSTSTTASRARTERFWLNREPPERELRLFHHEAELVP